MELPIPVENDVRNNDQLLAQDRVHLLQFLPSEIWKHVTTKIPKAYLNTSIENLSNSSPFYRNLFDGERTKYHFGKVVNILLQDESLLQLNDVLNCRQVCKTWNREIDKIFNLENTKLRLNQTTNNFNTYNKVATCLAHFEHTHRKTTVNGRNPFIVGKVILKVSNEYVFTGPNIMEINQLKLNGILIFMQKYGRFIKNISINFQLSNPQMYKEVLAKMRDWFFEMENLTKFSASSKVLYQFDIDHTETRLIYLRQNIPKFDRLNELHIETGIPEYIGLNLIAKNNHIKKLFIERNCASKVNYEYNLSSIPKLQNLTHLDINIGSIGNLENLKNIHLPYLSTLTLMGEVRYDFQHPKLSELFSVVETKFGSTLERLSMEIESYDNSEILDDTRAFQLNLPKVKEIRLLVVGQPVSLDFLLRMKETLERICVMVVHPGKVEGEIINMLNFQTLVAPHNPKYEFVHFDKPFEEIKFWVNNERSRIGMDRVKFSDKIVLT